MDQLLMIRIGVAFVIALIYMLFDIFNKRNVPSIYAYATVVVGILFTISYLNFTIITESAAIAAAVSALGYLVYKIGQLGAADVIELAAISLILPIQPAAYLVQNVQFGLPFILSVFVATGIIALLMVPIYYLPRAAKMMKKTFWRSIGRKDIFKSLFTLIAYGVFTIFLILEANLGVPGIVIMAALMIGSSLTIAFERPIMDSMVSFIPVSQFEEGDIVALNMMKKSDIASTRKKVKEFDRLVTYKIMKKMQGLHIKGKFPVYRQAMPLALPIFLGFVISILFGNLVLLLF